MTSHPFTGPLFIVGMPRSGTKLLRGLLNEHSQISIPLNETECLPYWSRHWKKWGDLSHRANFQRFYNDAITSVYFVHRYEEHGRRISASDWYNNCVNYDLSEVFKALIAYDAQYVPNGVWGDKSPGYLAHLPLLKSLFPNARFIHIIRDVRDHALSMNKTFGKSHIRAAQRWSDRITQAQSDAVFFPDDYLQTRYEDLLANPREQLERICDFIG